VLPVLPEPPEKPPPKGEPFPNGLPEEPEFPEPLPDDPDPEGSRVLPEEEAAERFEVLLVQAAWPMPTPAARTAKAAMPASTPLRT
jgi:hypothetical protein